MADRKTIGVLMNQIHGGFQAQLWPGIKTGAEDLDANLIFYCGMIPGFEYKESYQHEIAYYLPDIEHLDGLISMTVALAVGLKDELENYMQKYASLPLVNIGQEISLGSSIRFEGEKGPRIATLHLISAHQKKRIGFIKGSSHHEVAREHYQGYLTALEESKIPFDPELVFTAQMHLEGGAEAGKYFLSKSEESRIDALVASNDEQALGFIKYVQSQGIRVPEDIAVIGHDNILESSFSDPQLTTITQPTRNMGRLSVHQVMKKISGKPVSSQRLDVELERRSSCGCFTEIISGIKELYLNEKHFAPKEDPLLPIRRLLWESQLPSEDQNKLLVLLDNLISDPFNEESYYELGRNIQNFVGEDLLNVVDISILHRVISFTRNAISDHQHIGPGSTDSIESYFQFLRTSLSQASQTVQGMGMYQLGSIIYKMHDVTSSILYITNYDELRVTLNEEIQKLDIDECYVCLYDKPFKHNLGDAWVVPERSELIFAVKNSQMLELTDKPCEFPTNKLTPDWIDHSEQQILWSVFPLFFKNTHYGFIIQSLRHCRYSIDDMKYLMLRDFVSTAIENCALHQRVKDYQHQLENTNLKLKSQIFIDALTGLHNRAGFIKFAERRISESNRRPEFIAIVFFDMDGLKQINDNYGHAAGDEAIKAMADSLQMSVREQDMVARLAGDEFVAMMSEVEGEDTVESVLNRMRSNLKLTQRKHDLSFELDSSVGYVIYNSTEETLSLDELLALADKKLYENKRLKKERLAESLAS